MSEHFTVKAEDTRPQKRVKQEPSDGVMIIPALSALVRNSQSVNVKVVAALDMKATRMQVHGSLTSRSRS